MDIERSQQLETIIELSRDMVSKARENEWEEVAELEAKRRDLVLRCFQQPTSEQDATEVAAIIQEILRLNQEVTDLGKRFRNGLGTEIHSHNVGRAATAAYLSCAR